MATSRRTEVSSSMISTVHGDCSDEVHCLLFMFMIIENIVVLVTLEPDMSVDALMRELRVGPRLVLQLLSRMCLFTARKVKVLLKLHGRSPMAMSHTTETLTGIYRPVRFSNVDILCEQSPLRRGQCFRRSDGISCSTRIKKI